MVIVRRDAVLPITIEIEAHAVEGYPQVIHDEVRSLEDRCRGGARCRIEAEVAREARHIHFAVVHHAPSTFPVHRATKFFEPRPCSFAVDEVGRISNTPALVICQNPVPRIKERQLRHGLTVYSAGGDAVATAWRLAT